MTEDHIIGCILGTAVGDALGLPYEGLSRRRAARMFGPPDRYRFFFRRGMVSDQVTRTQRRLLRAGSSAQRSAGTAFRRNGSIGSWNGRVQSRGWNGFAGGSFTIQFGPVSEHVRLRLPVLGLGRQLHDTSRSAEHVRFGCLAGAQRALSDYRVVPRFPPARPAVLSRSIWATVIVHGPFRRVSDQQPPRPISHANDGRTIVSDHCANNMAAEDVTAAPPRIGVALADWETIPNLQAFAAVVPSNAPRTHGFQAAKYLGTSRNRQEFSHRGATPIGNNLCFL